MEQASNRVIRPESSWKQDVQSAVKTRNVQIFNLVMHPQASRRRPRRYNEPDFCLKIICKHTITHEPHLAKETSLSSPHDAHYG